MLEPRWLQCTDGLKDQEAIVSKTGLEFPELEEGNEQKVSDTPCLSVTAGLIHTGVANPHT